MGKKVKNIRKYDINTLPKPLVMKTINVYNLADNSIIYKNKIEKTK